LQYNGIIVDDVPMHLTPDLIGATHPLTMCGVVSLLPKSEELETKP